jgi:hypothetical protein
MSDSLALIVIFAGIPLIVLALVGFALLEAAGERRDNIVAHLRRHGRG